MKVKLVNTDIIFEDKVFEVNFQSSLGFSVENVVPQENLEKLYFMLQKHLYGNRYKIVETNLQIKLLKRFNYRERRVGGKTIPPVELLENSMDYEVLRIKWDWREDWETVKIPYEYVSKEILYFNTDNHQVCIIELCGKPMYIEFSDGYLHVGNKIYKGVGNIDTDYPTL